MTVIAVMGRLQASLLRHVKHQLLSCGSISYIYKIRMQFFHLIDHTETDARLAYRCRLEQVEIAVVLVGCGPSYVFTSNRLHVGGCKRQHQRLPSSCDVVVIDVVGLYRGRNEIGVSVV